jgi:hypothetical protein
VLPQAADRLDSALVGAIRQFDCPVLRLDAFNLAGGIFEMPGP